MNRRRHVSVEREIGRRGLRLASRDRVVLTLGYAFWRCIFIDDGLKIKLDSFWYDICFFWRYQLSLGS